MCLIVVICLPLYKVVFAQKNAAVCAICQPRGTVLDYVNPTAYKMSIHHKYCIFNLCDWALMFSQICQYLCVVMFVAPLLQLLPPCFRACVRLPSGLPWRPGWHVDANLLVSWHRTAPAWKEIDPLTPACHEIIELCSVPDCMLSWCSPNLFHSLIRGFEHRKGTDWAVPGGMTSMFLLSCWCHMEFEWSDFSISLCQLENTANSKTSQGFVLQSPPHMHDTIFKIPFAMGNINLQANNKQRFGLCSEACLLCCSGELLYRSTTKTD